VAKLFRTDGATGLVEVDGAIPTLTSSSASLYDSQVRRWEPLACASAREFGVPTHWILGMIFSESGGIPTARSPVGAVGLMQLHSPAAKQGFSDAELQDPETNIRLGARLIAVIYRDGDELPHIASKYNAGAGLDGRPHPSSSSPWGMREDAGHIDRTVAAANYAADTLVSCSTRAFPVAQRVPDDVPRPDPPTSPARPGALGPPLARTATSAGDLLPISIGLGLAWKFLRPKKRGKR
jgi:soluble lytic murein transglycosylase-like protein